jgi:1-deoxy-D-xylulose-5-phosphate reductoisomerase
MTATPKRVVLLGATGSIGQQALEVIAAHPDTFTLVGASAHRQVDALTDLVHRFNVPTVAIADTAHTHTLKTNTTATVIDGPHAATELAAIDCDLVLNGITGAIGAGLAIATSWALFAVQVALSDMTREEIGYATASAIGATLAPAA